jgi:RNA recognition motif-containing protein
MPIYVGNLSDQVTEEDVSTVFSGESIRRSSEPQPEP